MFFYDHRYKTEYGDVTASTINTDADISRTYALNVTCRTFDLAHSRGREDIYNPTCTDDFDRLDFLDP